MQGDANKSSQLEKNILKVVKRQNVVEKYSHKDNKKKEIK
jgi:hypothetical protein